MTYKIRNRVVQPGWQYWSVKAESPEDAIAKWKMGQCEFDGDEMEGSADCVGEPEIYGQEKQ